MPVVPNALERFVLLRLNRGPGPMLDAFASGAFDALGVGLDLGVFESLHDDPASPAELAGRLDADERGVEALLGVLATAGYVDARDGRYRLTALSERWVRPGSPDSFADYLRFWREVVLPFCRDHAADAVRDGRPTETVYEWLDDRPEHWPLAQRAFETAARVVSDDVVAAVAPAEGERVLDVGGGHGRFSIACCEAAPGVAARIVDDPAALAVAEENVAAAGLEDRVTLAGGDYFDADFGAEFDLALVCNVLHAHGADDCRRLLARVRDALVPGGRVAVLDQFDADGGLPLARTATRTIDYVYHATLGGRVHDEAAVESWLADAGFATPERHHFRTAGSTLLVAERRD